MRGQPACPAICLMSDHSHPFPGPYGGLADSPDPQCKRPLTRLPLIDGFGVCATDFRWLTLCTDMITAKEKAHKK